VAGEIELMSPERNAVRAQTCFERALEIARAQQARSFELRAAATRSDRVLDDASDPAMPSGKEERALVARRSKRWHRLSRPSVSQKPKAFRGEPEERIPHSA
jgi:hypothetical protein